MSHVWVKVGQSENERHRYSGVECYHGAEPQIIASPVCLYTAENIWITMCTTTHIKYTELAGLNG